MRTIWLVRHGQPELPAGAAYHSENMILSSLGRLQARLAGIALGTPETVWCSRLPRCCMTAQQVGRRAVVLEGLEELGPGEDAEQGLMRFEAALDGLLEKTQGDLVIISHLDVIQLLLCRLTGRSPAHQFWIPYAGITRLRVCGGRLEPMSWGESAHPELGYGECLALLQCLDTPQKIVAHCRAVEEAALRLCDQVQAGDPERGVVTAAALLHDIARQGPRHDVVGAEWLEELGYPRLAAIVRTHHDCGAGEQPLEAAIVNLADKLVLEDRHVTLEERFAASAVKCETPEARAVHARRFEEACRLRARLLGQ